MVKPPKDPTFTHQDINDWTDATKHVRPRKGVTIEQAKESADDNPPTHTPTRIKLSDIMHATTAKAQPEKKHSYSYLKLNDSSHVDGKLAAKMRHGKMKIDAKLDLHGYYHEHAIDAFEQFIERATQSGKRCVLVVTGKGKDAPVEFGVLHQNAPRWINNIPAVRKNVLMFCHSQPKDGGTGALYILLKRKRT